MLRSLTALSLLVLAGCAANQTNSDTAETPNTLTRAEANDGYQLLFDGRSMEHWRGFKKDEVPEGWLIEDGALTRTQSGGDIITRETYGSFELRMEWKISPGGNSGIMWHVIESDGVNATYESGPEMQILDNTGHPGVEPLNAAGACYDLYPAEVSAAKPVGEWNQVRLRVHRGKVEQWLNGSLICEYTLWSDDWNARVQASKFSSMPHFAVAREGHIALQDHQSPVWFRNLRIRRL
jgi:3-keto-disaccharide hydrolase